MSETYVSGLDLGQLADYSALVIVRCHGSGDELTAKVRHIHRWQLGTPYPKIVDDLVKLFASDPTADSTLAVDATGVGVAVVDMIRDSKIRAQVRPWTITAGFKPTEDTVPKKDLVGAVQAMSGNRRLTVPKNLALAELLTKELDTFRMRITLDRNESFGAWRERDHDDLVLALALALWYATNFSNSSKEILAANRANAGRTMTDRLPPGTFKQKKHGR